MDLRCRTAAVLRLHTYQHSSPQQQPHPLQTSLAGVLGVVNEPRALDIIAENCLNCRFNSPVLPVINSFVTWDCYPMAQVAVL
jgi:hypothetical protein